MAVTLPSRCERFADETALDTININNLKKV